MSVPMRWVGPQVNKFEQVFSDDHQMSVPGEESPEIWCLVEGGVCPQSDVWGGRVVPQV